MPSNLRDSVREVFTADLRSLGLMRILTGVGLLGDIIYRARDLEAHYTDQGLVSLETARALVKHFGWFSLHTLSGSYGYQLVLTTLFFIFALMLTLGFMTRLAAPLCWLLFVSVQNRFFFGDYPGDYILTMLLLSGIFLPWGACFSIDARRRRARGEAAPAPRYRGLSAYALFFLFAIFISKTGLSKIAAGGRWLDGTALFCVLSAVRYSSRWLDWSLEYLGLLKTISYAVPWIETFFPVFFFLPWKNGAVRTAAIAACCVMFAGFQIGLDLHLLPYLAATAYLGWLPPWFWERLLPRLSRRVSWTAAATPEVSSDSRLLPTSAHVYINNLMVGVVLTLNATHYYYKIGNFGYFSSPRTPPVLVDSTMNFLKIKNIYRMFSDPEVFEASDGWDVAPGELASGRKINVFTGEALSFERPGDLVASIRGFRWRQYLTLVNWYPTWNPKNITSYHAVESSKLREDFVRFLCHQWNSAHEGPDRLVRVNLDMVVSPVRYGQPRVPPKVVELLDKAYACEAGTPPASPGTLVVAP
ncbi:hypothetical protein [Hyalangium versicolor]|uniref:hypothetical protein n=1 Tax=Hyalangium versicolor TaxID=2861190 RepID=UPI001CC9903C|nr:hypothetical protein [Hyalangium versicolor]